MSLSLALQSLPSETLQRAFLFGATVLLPHDDNNIIKRAKLSDVQIIYCLVNDAHAGQYFARSWLFSAAMPPRIRADRAF